MERIRRYLWRYRLPVALGALFVLATNAVGLLAPWVLKEAVDALEAGATPRALLVYAGLILGVAVVQGVFRFLMRNTLIGVSRRIEFDLRMDIFDHLQKLPLEFYQRNPTGEIVSRATSDLENVRLLLGPGLMNLLNTVVLFTGAVALMASLSPRLMLASMAPLPVAALLMSRGAGLFHRRYRLVQEAGARLSARAQENFTGIRVVKAYVQEESQVAAFRRGNADYLGENMRLARLMSLFHPLIGFVVGLTFVIVLWAGGRMIIRGSLTIGELVAFLGYLAMLTWPAIATGWVVNLVQRGAASMARIDLILGTEPAIAEPPEPAPLEKVSGAVRFDDLTFTYPGMKEPALRGVTLDVRPGEKVAVVGRTGSGKSTLVSLIPRLFNPPPETLLVDGWDVNRVPLALLRSSMGLVPQETFLFSDTLERNIGLGARGPEASVEEAARLAGLSADIDSFPLGLATMLGERGITLSGGQKQRAALARAVIRDPRILILDDAFSSVDARTEREILANLSGLMAGRTTIIVTHRLASIADADRIFLLEDGRLAESGTHAELMAAGGRYAEMYRRQGILEELEREEAP